MRRSIMRPHELPCGIVAPNRRLVQFCFTLKNVPGALACVVEEIARWRINILSGHISALPGEEHGYATFFADLTGLALDVDAILDGLRSLDVVEDVHILEPELPGMIIDVAHFPLKFLGQDSVIIDLNMVGHMFSRLYEVFETGASVILYEMGHRAGRAAAETVLKFGLRGLDALRAIMALGVARGWCVPELLEWDETVPRLVMRLWDNFECKPIAGQRDRPSSHLMRGLIAGLVEGLTGKKVKVKEVKCIAEGDDYCEFVAEGYETIA
ncbi:MAG TPA: hypothetical protein ENF34_02295 [Candidatus Bathyarchaeota archaeon]|nr:hypothetical protein [Candidatus Bathyarchaeota archaeon]